MGTLAKNHKIDDILYHPSNLVKIYELIGRKRQFKCMEQCLGKEMSIKDEWIKIIGVLSFELKLKEKALLLDKTKPENEVHKGTTDDIKRKSYAINETSSEAKKCAFCDIGHVATITRKGKIIVNYFACPKFAKMNPQERLNKLKRIGFCFQCLSPGLKKGHNGFCFSKFNCPDDSRKRFDCGYHVLM